MPQNKFYLDEQKQQEIVISWRGIWKDITVSYNGQALGGFPNFTALKEGGMFHLPDGSQLGIHYSSAYGDQGLRVSHNGRPLPGTSGDPEAKLKGIFGIACFIGGLSILLGFLGQFGIVEFLEDAGFGWLSILAGALIGTLGYFTWKQKSPLALTFIIVILLLDIVSVLYIAAVSDGRFPMTGVGLKVLFIIQFARGYRAITEYRNWKMMDESKAAGSFSPPQHY